MGCHTGGQIKVTEQDWFNLERRYQETFGTNIPRMMLPADEEAAVALVREAIVKRDETVFERGILGDACI